LSKGEKFAMSVSKAADPLKPRRKGTQDSDMSFGMTDLAPPGAMQECESCSKPTEEYLINGLCKQCHELHVKVAKAKRQGK
jgi:Zn finger protein HypA/HybF involved in hydrogenase expression